LIDNKVKSKFNLLNRASNVYDISPKFLVNFKNYSLTFISAPEIRWTLEKNNSRLILNFGYFFIFLKKMVELSGNIGWCATRFLLCGLVGLP